MRPPAAGDGDDIIWHQSGPGGGGWIQSVAWDPHDSSTLYVGCDVGGFYVSFDGGRHFEIRNRGLQDYFIEAIAVHPRDNRVILLGTEGGIFRTTDQGKNWQRIRTGFPHAQRWSFSCPIGAVAFAAVNPNVVYAGVGRPRWSSGGQGAIYRSDDAGLTWRNVSAGQLPPDAIISDIKLKPGEAGLVLAASNRGIFRSVEAGRTWIKSSDGLPQFYAEKMAFAASNPNVVYATLRTTARAEQPWNGGIYRSEDAGGSWHPVNGEGLARQLGQSDASPYMTSNYKEILVDARDPDVVYVGNRDWVSAGVRKTSNGGRNWNPVMHREGGAKNVDYGWITQWGPAVECMAMSPADSDRLAVGTSGHLFITRNGGKTWQQYYCQQFSDGRFAGNGLEVTCLHDIVSDPVRRERLYYCFYDIGLLVSDDHGKTFRRSVRGMKHDGNCFNVVVDPQSPSKLWAGTGEWGSNVGDICRSDDDGQTWKVVGWPQSGLPVGQTKHLVLDLQSRAGSRRLLVASQGNGLFESRDGGNTWQNLNSILPASVVKEPRGLLLDPKDSQHIVAALGGEPGKGSGIYETHDGGHGWRRLNQDTPFADITALAADPQHFDTLYVCARESYSQTAGRSYPGGVFKTADGGNTWIQILDYHFASAIAISPVDTKTLYVCTTDHPFHDGSVAEGVLKSVDCGVSWQHENQGLSLLNCSSLTIGRHNPALLYLGTGGNGAFIGTDRAIATKTAGKQQAVPSTSPPLR